MKLFNILLIISLLLFVCGCSEDKIKLYSDEIRQHPASAEAYLKRGDEYFNRNMSIEAVSDYVRAFKLSPRYTNNYKHDGIACFFVHRINDKGLEVSPMNSGSEEALIKLLSKKSGRNNSINAYPFYWIGKFLKLL